MKALLSPLSFTQIIYNNSLEISLQDKLTSDLWGKYFITMDVGNFFSRKGRIVDFSRVALKFFHGRSQKVVKFNFTHSKLRNQPILLNIQKFQNAEGVKAHPPTPMRITIISNIYCYEHTRFQGQIISFHFVKQVQVHSMFTA